MSGLFLQAVKFIGVSGLGWILDFCTYTVLGFFSQDLSVNNIISSWVGVTFVFLYGTKGEIQNNSRIPLKLKYIIYLLYQCVLIFFISKLLNTINAVIVEKTMIDLILRYSSIISKILVTPITMVLNFFVMKGVVEKI